MKLFSKLSSFIFAVVVSSMLTLLPSFDASLNIGLLSDTSVLAAEEQRAPPPSRSTQQLSRRVYQRIEEIVEFRDLEQYAEATVILDELKELDDEGRLNDREQYMMWLFYANLDQMQENYPASIASYERIIELENVSPNDMEQTLNMLGQLSLQVEEFQDAADYFLQLIDFAFEVNPQWYLRVTQAYYSMESLSEALPYLLTHMDLTRGAGEGVPESTYNLLVSIYYTLEDYTSTMQTLREKVILFDLANDWTFLAGINAELDNQDEQAYLFYISNLKGYLDSESELMTLAALLYNYENPYAGAVVVQDGMDAGIIEENEENLAFLSLAYQIAREDALAVEPLVRAAEMSEDGELYSRLGNIYSNLSEFENALEAFDQALDKGGIDRTGDIYLRQARAFYELNRFTEGVVVARLAADDERTESQSASWIEILNREKARYDSNTSRRIELEGYFR